MNIKYFFRLMFTFNIVFCFNCLAQYPDHPQMPKLTPQSPEAAAMDKYGEYPVSLFTGIPEINIPLYEIKTNKFTLPISLSYHASGIKVNDFASWIGLGWSLNAGGRISRKVQGKDDQTHIRNIRSAGSINSCESSDYLYLQEIANQTDDWDAEADIYMYNFLGRSGKYVYSDTLRATMLPYCGMKTESISFPNKLADELGNIYSFGYPDHQSTEYPDKTGTDPTSSWLLTEMVDAGGTDSMSIDYQTVGTGPLGIDFVDYVTVMDDHYYECPPCINYTTGINTPSSYGIMTYGNEIVPEKISFQNGFVRFIPSDSNRLDRPSYGTYYTGFKSLSEIQIFSFEDTITPIRTIVLYQDYFDNDGDKRLKLDSLKIFDKNLQAIKKYKFDYNTSVKLPSYNSKAKDFWGYYNGKYNDLLLPRMTIEFLGDNGSSTTYPTIGSCTQGGREPDTSYMQAYMLDTITYPTGGYTTFEYETNQYLDSTTSKYAGGLRIHKIKSYTENGISLTKTYKYGEGESGDGRLNVFLSDFYFSTPSVTYQDLHYEDCEWGWFEEVIRSRTFTSNPCTDLNPFDGSPVVYRTVTEYIGDETNNIGKTIYQYTDTADKLNSYVSIDKSYRDDRSYMRGLLKSKTDYKYENGNYKKVYELINSYFAFQRQSIYLTFKSVQRWHFDGSCWPSDLCKEYAYCNTPISFGDNLLTESKEFFYNMTDTNKFVLKTTDYTYNNQVNTQISSITASTSSQNALITYYKYPTDDSSEYYFPEMINKNIVGVRIQEDHYRNAVPLITRKTYFGKYNSELFADSIVKFRTGTNPLETRIKYGDYDQSGNLLSVAKENDIPISYEYDNYNQIIAEVTNVDSKSFYFNNFENNDGNSSLNDCKTGRKSNTDSIFIPFNNLKNGSYVLSWWSKSSGIWTFNCDTVSVTNDSGTTIHGQVDDVRLYPDSSLMKTYTYDPLIGLTSVTDENNIISYYEYDAFGRLCRIKDNNGKVIKEIKYNYK